MGEIDIRKQIYGERESVERYTNEIKRSHISERNKELILEFKDFCCALGNSPHRIGIVLRHLKMFAERIDTDLDKAERKDIERAVSKLNDSHYSDWTKVTTKKVVKRFYRWLYNKEDSDPLPDCVRWIKCSNPPNNLKKEDLITKDEIERMIRTTSQLMYKTLISVLYEGAMRPGELLQMRLKDVTFNQNYVTVYVRGKMQKSIGDRKIYLIQSYDLLLNWMQNHPFRNNPEHPIWIVSTRQIYKKKGLYGKAISIEFLNQIIKKCAKNAEMRKKVYAYLFRHSRGTQLYIELGESMAKKIMGHTPDSSMAKVYNHLNEEDILQKLKEINGITETKKEEKNGICYRCNHPNPFGSTICSACGLTLNIREAMIIGAERKAQEEQMHMMKQILDSLQKNPEILKVMQNPEFIEQQAEALAKKMFERWKEGQEKKE